MGKILTAACGAGHGDECNVVGKRSTLGWRGGLFSRKVKEAPVKGEGGGRALSSQLGHTTPSPASGPHRVCVRNPADTLLIKEICQPKSSQKLIANKKRVHLRGQNEINLGDTGVILFSLLLLWFSLYGSQIYLLS